jgi:SAM-dependent methyltransferase
MSEIEVEGVDRPAWAPRDIDLERPSVARVYDYWLGGAHNFAADREVAKKALEAMPELRGIILNHRAFLRRAVRNLLDLGVRQFLDLGSGIPTAGNVHEIAQSNDPTAKVVYVDIDPVAVAHSRSLLAGNTHAAVVQNDVRDAQAVLDSSEVKALLDFDEPVAILMIALLHFVPDEDDPRKILATYRDALSSGGYLVASHAAYEDGEETEGGKQVRALYDRNVAPMTYRNRVEFTALFDGFELIEPGVARLPLWRPESLDDVDDQSRRVPALAAVGRKP